LANRKGDLTMDLSKKRPERMQERGGRDPDRPAPPKMQIGAEIGKLKRMYHKLTTRPDDPNRDFLLGYFARGYIMCRREYGEHFIMRAKEVFFESWKQDALEFGKDPMGTEIPEKTMETNDILLTELRMSGECPEVEQVALLYQELREALRKFMQ
jgi:hypothetical protein